MRRKFVKAVPKLTNLILSDLDFEDFEDPRIDELGSQYLFSLDFADWRVAGFAGSKPGILRNPGFEGFEACLLQIRQFTNS